MTLEVDGDVRSVRRGSWSVGSGWPRRGRHINKAKPSNTIPESGGIGHCQSQFLFIEIGDEIIDGYFVCAKNEDYEKNRQRRRQLEI